MTRLRYAGSIAEIAGQYFDVPDELTGAKACEWIELQHENSLIDAQLQAESANTVEPEPQEPSPLPTEEETGEPDPLVGLRAELAGLKSQIDSPDVATLVSAQSSLNQSIQSLHTQTTRAAEESARIEPFKNREGPPRSGGILPPRIQQERKVILNPSDGEMRVASAKNAMQPWSARCWICISMRRIQIANQRCPPSITGSDA